jgi:hypothetical protein
MFDRFVLVNSPFKDCPIKQCGHQTHFPRIKGDAGIPPPIAQ